MSEEKTNQQEPDTSLPVAEEMDELAILIKEYLSAKTFYAKQRLVEGNEILLSDLADSAFAGLIYQHQDNPHLKRTLEVHQHMLRRSREIGVHRAFIEMRKIIDDFVAEPEDGPAPETLALVNTIGEFMVRESYQDKRRWLDEHPELLTNHADDVFDNLIRTHTSRGQSNVVRQLIVHRDLLRTCRERGIDEAFERMENPPDALDIIVDNTIAVLTDRADARSSWAETVTQSRIRAAELEDDEMLKLLRAISRLLNDEHFLEIDPELEGDHAQAWQRILDAVENNSL